MNRTISFSSRDFKMTEGVKSRIQDKLTKLDKFDKSNQVVKAVLYANKGSLAQIELSLNAYGETFRTKQSREDLYEAIDVSINTIEKQVRRHLDSNKNNQRESIRFQETKVVEENNEPKIVKRKVISGKPMFEQEAILQMEMLNHRSFIFHNADTNSPCMIYKRNDGDYGIIETL